MDPGITERERNDATAALEQLLDRLPAKDGARARSLIGQKPTPYWFRPEYGSPGSILRPAKNGIHEVYRIFSGSTHGGLGIIFNDDGLVEDIEPRAHPRSTQRAISAATRLFLEVCRIRDQWDNDGVGEDAYCNLVMRNNALSK